MTSRTNFHGAFGDVNVRELFELVIHAGKLLLHVFGRLVGNIQISSTVFATAALANFGVNGARDNVTGGKLHALGIVLLHEALTVFVAKNSAFTAHSFRYRYPLDAGRPDHTRGMKLNKLHIEQLSSGVISKRHAVTGVLPGVRRDAIGLANAACSHHNRFRFQHHKAALLAPITERAYNTLAIGKQADDSALHEDVKAHLHAAVLKRADHLQASAVAYMAEPFESMAA